MYGTCRRCGARVRSAPSPSDGPIRLNATPDPDGGTISIAHGFAMKNDLPAAEHLRRLGVPLYSKHNCKAKRGRSGTY